MARVPPLVSVVVVSYNTREKLRRCLEAIGTEHETIVIDNASGDGSPEMVARDFPSVRLIRSGENLGFGRANNRGAEIATGELLLFLNSDCYADPGAINRLARSFDDLSVSGAGGRLLNLDGSLQNSTANAMSLFAVFWEQSFLEKVRPIYWTTPRLFREAEALLEDELARARTDLPDFAVVVPTPQVMGACLMCRRISFPGFDERFFLYMEDTMLCDALREMGQIVWNHGATFVHELGASSAKEWWRGVARYNAGKELYFRVTQGEGTARWCRTMNRAGALLRMIVKPRRLYGFWRVFRA
ncbi:glycosyltransferase [bacterium]|nr:MAG: glycosyltransferase [bacterium]